MEEADELVWSELNHRQQTPESWREMASTPAAASFTLLHNCSRLLYNTATHNYSEPASHSAEGIFRSFPRRKTPLTSCCSRNWILRTELGSLLASPSSSMKSPVSGSNRKFLSSSSYSANLGTLLPPTAQTLKEYLHRSYTLCTLDRIPNEKLCNV